ncbi:MAG: hypothetical protein ACFB13_06965 [Kiloniellaceae bacterium]
MSLLPSESCKFIVTWFHRDDEQFGDRIVGQVDAPGLSARTVQDIFRLDQVDHAVSGCHPVTAGERGRIERILGRPLDLGKFDYFVEAVQT